MLGEKLLKLRKKFGYSQQELADKLSVTRQTISNWECGQGAPTIDKAMELAAIFGISLDDLVGDQVNVIVSEPHSEAAGREDKKETVATLIDINAVNGVEIVEVD